MRRFIMGDIHGKFNYMMDVLKKSGFDYEKDLLIQIGDLVDRGPEPFKCILELSKIKNLVLIKGNHDAAWENYMKEGYNPLGMYGNGVQATISAWDRVNDEEKAICQKFFNDQKLYYISEDNIMFVHGGFPDDEKLEDVTPHVFYWDRELVNSAMKLKDGGVVPTKYNFKKIYIGHTPTIYWGQLLPIDRGGLLNIDTGSGKGGPLTIMNIDTQEYWQSDLDQHDREKLIEYGLIKEIKSDSSEAAQKEAA